MNRILLAFVPVVVGCAATPITHRYVDTEVGYTDAFGAPQDTQFAATAEAEREVIRITVFERSTCDKLRMKIVSRVDQAMRGDQIVSQEPAKQMQILAGKDGTVTCSERFARGVWVGLRVGSQTYRLGIPSPRGEVVANLSGELKQSLYAENAPSEATVVVSGVDAGTVSLANLNSHEARLDALLAELRAILGKDDAAITKDDIAHSYELYDQLGQLDTGGDARVSALRSRFVEVVYQRKQREQTENLKRNLKALEEAKGLLSSLSGGLVPAYVLVAIRDGLATPDALVWARGEAAIAVRHSPALCGTPFTWGAVTPSAYSPVTRAAFSYLHFAYDDPFQSEIRGLCGRVPR